MSQGLQLSTIGGAYNITTTSTAPPTAPTNPVINTTESILTLSLVGNKKVLKKFTGDYKEVSTLKGYVSNITSLQTWTSAIPSGSTTLQVLLYY